MSKLLSWYCLDAQSFVGVIVKDCPAKTGLTWEIYSKAIADWVGKQNKVPAPGLATTLGIVHFNDVYQVGDQKVEIDHKKETINVTKFATLLANITAKWNKRNDGKTDGLIVFSGDLFSPSVESSITRGKHMVSRECFISDVMADPTFYNSRPSSMLSVSTLDVLVSSVLNWRRPPFTMSCRKP